MLDTGMSTDEHEDYLFGDIPNDDFRAMTGGNFAKLFGIEMPSLV